MNLTILTIDTLSTQGEGIGRVEGKAVFVPFTLPGETWDVRVIQSKKNYERALPVELREHAPEAPERIHPQCPYFGQCGGCHLQHMTYEDQLVWKQRWLTETFRRLVHLEVQPAALVASPPWEYRNKISLSIMNHEGEIHFAYHHIGMPGRLIPVEDCPIAHPVIRHAIPRLAKELARVPLRFPKHSARSSTWPHAQFRMVDGRLDIAFYDLLIAKEDRERLCQSAMKEDANRPQLQWNPVVPSPQDDPMDDNISSNSFFQVNDSVREKLYQHILDLPFQQSDFVLDGYCGVGLLSRRLANRFKQVLGVENNASAVSDATRAAEKTGLADRVRFELCSVEQFFSKWNTALSGCILNPPRAGLSTDVRRHLIRLQPQEIVIVSCHPAALARDVQSLTEAGYQIVSLQPFDMFPQTYHLETVVYLRRS